MKKQQQGFQGTGMKYGAGEMRRGSGCNEAVIIGTRFWPSNASASASTRLRASTHSRPNQTQTAGEAKTKQAHAKRKRGLMGWDEV